MTFEEAHKNFEYKDGRLFWKVRRSNFTAPGDRAGCKQETHWRVTLAGRNYSSTKIIWLLHTGEWRARIKHRDGDNFNCRIENLY